MKTNLLVDKHMKSVGLLVVVLQASLLAAACGPHAQPTPAALQWIKGSSEQFAILEDQDFADEYLFHASVVAAPSFHKDAILFHSPVQVVRLKFLESNAGTELMVVSEDPDKTWISFAASKGPDGRIEVDFSRLGMQFNNGGASQIFTNIKVPGSADSAWKTYGQGRLTHLMQDQAIIVADVAHPVTTLRRLESGGYAVGARQGEITIRLSLQKTSALPKQPAAPKVHEARSQGFGFFPADRRGLALRYRSDATALEAAQDLSPINRLAVPDNGGVTIYLKDFPEAYFAAGRDAVLAWNQAFGREALRVEAAPTHVDHGDPRYHVIKWMDDMDASVSWAGASKFIEDPRDGAILNVDIVVNGAFLRTGLSNVHQESQTLVSRLGDLPLISAAGEIPELPFAIGQRRGDLETYLQRTYAATITHELGHSLGLKHNFAGSTESSAPGLSTASVMDYFPRPLRDLGAQIGAYDSAAIAWAYRGIEPARRFAYCDEAGLTSEVYCNQEDSGDPYVYVPTTLRNSVRVVAAAPLADTLSWRAPLYTQISNAMKLLALDYLLPSERREDIVREVNQAAYDIAAAQPAPDLSSEEQAAVAANLEWLRKALAEARTFYDLAP